MDQRRLGSKTLVALVALFFCVGAASAMANPTNAHVADAHGGAAHGIGHVDLEESNTSIDFLLPAGLGSLLGAALLRALTRRSSVRAVALGLALALGVFTLETAVHSVHHLADPDARAACPVLTGSQHLSWGEAQVADAGVPRLCASAAPMVRLADAPRWQIYRPHQGRAPPA